MQCTNCNFFNMPGSAACGRCGSSLQLNGTITAVMPPRASPMRKRIRRMFPVRRIYLQMSERAIASGVVRCSPQGSMLLFLLWSAIPGWPHFARNQHVRGHVFLWGFVLFFVLGIALMGSTWGSIFIGLLFSIHSSAIADLVNQRYDTDTSVAMRMGRALAVSAVLFLAIYYPMGELIGWVAAPYQLEVPLAPFERGDVVIVSSTRGPRAGDVVLYDIPDARAAIIWHNGPRQMLIEGRNIDRVLAGPGSIVECRDGGLVVNGQFSRQLPLNRLTYPGKWSFTVPPNRYFILPSDEAGILDNLSNWTAIGLVPAESITGRVYLRSQPWKRFAFIR